MSLRSRPQPVCPRSVRPEPVDGQRRAPSLPFDPSTSSGQAKLRANGVWALRAHGVCALLAAVAVCTAQANEAAPLADDPAVEQRLLHISEELRCLVCQNESLAGSRADLALDLKREIRVLIKQGKTDQEVRDFLVSRYGDFVLYRPPVKPTTWLLWGGPFVLLAGALAGLITFLRRRTPADAALSPDEQRQADALLNRGDS